MSIAVWSELKGSSRSLRAIMHGNQKTRKCIRVTIHR